MKKTLLVALLALFSVGSSWSQENDKKYEEYWAKVDSLERKGLYRMALKEVNKIFDFAAKMSNHNQVIKSVLYELKFNSYMEEDDYVIGISRLDSLIKEAPSPSKEILHSLSAEVHWGYYNSNQWKFQNRTHVAEVDLSDIRTWDLKRIAEKVQYHYLKSLINSSHSKKELIKDYDQIASYTSTDASKNMRPTLFDFLAHRALDFFQYNNFNVPGPGETFVIKDKRFFGANSSFLTASENITTVDSLNTKFYALKLYYELTKFHSQEKNKNALFSIELERMKFIQSNSILDLGDDLYYNGLERMANAYQQDDFSSEAWYEIAKVHYNKGATYSFLADTTGRWEYTVAMEVSKNTMKKYPDSYGSNQCDALIHQITEKKLNIIGELAIPSQVESRFRLEYRNTEKFYYKIVQYDFKKVNSGKNDWNKMVKYLRKTKGVYQEELNLKNPKDYQVHSTEVVIPELENGFYYVIVGSDPAYLESGEAFSFMPLWVSNITYQIRDLGKVQEVLITDRITGKPLVGAKASVTYQKYNYLIRKYEQKILGQYTTNEDGRFDFDPKDEYYTYFVNLKYEGEIYEPHSGHYSYRYYETEDRVVTQFFTDRTIYRPGQTIFFKGIVMDQGKDKRALKKEFTTTVTFYDVNSQEIAHQEVTTNKFGSFEGEFIAPFGVLTGQMRIQDAYGSKYFRVEEYKRPKFNVMMNPIEGEFQLNDKIEATGFAQAFAGNFIDGAEVNYRVTRTTTYYGWSWWWWRPYEAPKEISHGELTTDENGEFSVNFNALPDMTSDPKDLPLFTYTVYVDVTDINGETHSSSTNVIVGYQSLQLSSNLKSQINSQESFVLKLSTTNLNGQDIPAKGKISVDKLLSPEVPLYDRLWSKVDLPMLSEKEFKEKFPNHVYSNENDQFNWKVESRVFESGFDTKITDSVVISNLATWDPGVYKYTAVAKDKNGVDIMDVYYFTLFNPTADKTPANEIFWLKELDNTAEPGEVISVLLGTAESELEVFFDLEVKNEIVESNHFTLAKGQKKLDFLVEEKHRGNFTVHFSVVHNNRMFGRSVTVIVPYTNKNLDLEFSTFRNKLLPGQDEEWTMTIKNSAGEKEMAELLATLYDASLDELYTPNSYYLNVWQNYYGNKSWQNPLGIGTSYANNYHYDWNSYRSHPYRYFPTLNYHGYSTYYYGNYYYYDRADGDYYEDDMNGLALDEEVSEMEVMDGSTGKEKKEGHGNRSETSSSMDKLMPMGGAESGKAGQTRDGTLGINGYLNTKDKDVDLSGVKVRSNFNETAFFFPQLQTDAEGNVKIKFTIPESLTKWKFVGMAHTEDLKIGLINEEVVTQKDLMVVPNAPRFLREGDKITLSSKISNMSDEELEGVIQLEFLDPFTEKIIDDKFNHKTKQLEFKVEAGKSTSVSWTVDVPYEISATMFRVVAKAGDFSDGEENVLPILSNRMLVTESMPMPIRGNQTREFKFEKLLNNKSKTLKHHRYTVEFTSNPAWYALQAMPYMMEYPYECAEQTFTRYYSNAIATHIMNSNPKIQKIIEDWGENSPEAFLSNLQKNQELKSLMLEETPWVLDAKSEEQSKKNLSILLDLNRMSKELDKALGKTINNQSANGGWPWFPGMKENRYITQHIITGMGHLDHLGIKDIREDKKVWNMIKKGVDYLDGEIKRDYRLAKKYDPAYLTNQHIGYTQVQYLYARSYFPEIAMNKSTKEAVNYYKDQAIKFWLQFNIYGEGMIALAAHRFEMKELATDIVKSLKDRSIQKDEFGMYWKDYYVGYYWYEAPVETQALMIEMFDEVTNDQESVEELKIWLLKEKQTTNWKTTKQTTEAVYALLLKGSDLLASDELVEITVGGKEIEYVDNAMKDNPYQVKVEAGTGHFKTAWGGKNVRENMGDIKLVKKDKGIAWGAAYWQYFEDLDKITFAETNLSLEKGLFLIKTTDTGEELVPVNENNILKVGQKIRVRIELRTDRNLEYVHMKDMRAAGFEPLNVLSTFKYQDGLGYYQATKDAATNFFFDFIPKGTHVFEYDLRVQHKGNMSNGITTIQCMYAPEFTSHSEGIRVQVK
jgi:Bacterial Alpha-2-macroglobulin MG10 domain/Alpha-2-macroglobulin family/MG2 domain